jgi:hypothetical protein
MPHFKCVACKARLYSPAGAADLVGDLCPGCGSLLEPVAELSEIVGFRAIKPRGSSASSGAAGAHQRLADQIGVVRARRGANRSEAPLDAERWLDDGGSFGPGAVAEAVDLPPDWRSSHERS